MSKRQKISQLLLKPFVSPEQFDFWSRELGSTAAWSRCHAKVVSITQESDNTFSLKLKPNSNFNGFTAGQHVNITAEIKGVRVTRCYSITNVPTDKTVDITVRAEPDGLMSTWLTQQARVGSVVELGRVFGELTLPCDNDEPLVLLAAGSGITPMMSLIRQAQFGQPELEITLLYWEKTSPQFCFDDELAAINASPSKIRIYKIATQVEGSGPLCERINKKQISRLLPELNTSLVYVCGGSGFVQAANEIVKPVAKSFLAEAFTPAANFSPPDEEMQFEVELLKSGRTVTVSNQGDLLTALEEQGVSVESGCRMGICNTCTCQKREGTTMATDSNLINSEQNSAIRLCVSRAVQNLQLDL